MNRERAIGLIAHRALAEQWAQAVAETAEGKLVLVASELPDSVSTEFIDLLLESNDRLGFGKARRLSMLLAGELGEYCVVTDGDGQYAVPELRRLQERLIESDADAVIPQRTSRAVWMTVDGERVSREPFERLETLCAGRVAGVDLPRSFDAQPGGFGFHRRLLPEVLPMTDWLADWEVTVSILEGHSYETVEIETVPETQEETTFTWNDQLEKLAQIEAIGEISVAKVYATNRAQFAEREQELIERALEESPRGDVDG